VRLPAAHALARNLTLGFLSLLLIAGLLSDWLVPHSVASTGALQSSLAGASAAQLLAWWLLATRNVLAVSATASLIGGLFGSALGALAIYGAGGVSGALSRLVGFAGAFPGLLLVGLFRLGDPSRGVLKLYGAHADVKAIVAEKVAPERLQRRFAELPIADHHFAVKGIEPGRATFLVAQMWHAFAQAIHAGRDGSPSFRDKLKIHYIWDAVEHSSRERRWARVDYSLLAPA